MAKIIPFPNADSVPPQNRNEIIIAIIFKLKTGATDRFSTDFHEEIKRFPYKTISDEQRSYLEQEMTKIYHYMPIQYYDVDQLDSDCVFKFQSSKPPQDWPLKLSLQEQVYIKYERARSVGCGHYIRGCEVQCMTCKKFYPCRFCHNEQEDHELPRFETTTVRCNFCQQIQPISQYCTNCKASFGSYFCYKCRIICGMGAEAKPNYHCDGCGQCKVGIKKMSQHCYKCNACISVQAFPTHRCIQASGNCIVCMGDLVKTTFGVVILNCTHMLHSHCYYELIQKGNFKCPVCKRFLPVDQDKEWILKQQKEIYNLLFVPVQMEGIAVQTLCNDCGGKQVVEMHPLLYYCWKCQNFNCEVVEQIGYVGEILHVEGAPRPRHCTPQDVFEVLQVRFAKGMSREEIEREIGTKIDEQSAKVIGQFLNRDVKSLEDVKRCIMILRNHVSVGLDLNDPSDE